MVLPFVETMITQVCNLSCLGCTNYSDLKHSGYVSWHEGKQQIEPWLARIRIDDFGIMGGEPLINPEVREWLTGVRELLPNSQIRFTTNGELLHKNLDIIELAHDLGNIVFKVTVHRNNQILEDTIKKMFDLYKWESVEEHGVKRFKTSNNLRLQINRPTTFLKTYLNNYENMEPHDSDPVEAFKICVQQQCPLLFNGRIYKCSTSGLLESTLAKFNWPNRDKWLPYLTSGIGPYDTDSIVSEFIANFGKPEKLCRQCPSQSRSVVNHYETVVVK